LLRRNIREHYHQRSNRVNVATTVAAKNGERRPGFALQNRALMI